jgi:heme-degrading monooxygenase HmoA
MNDEIVTVFRSWLDPTDRVRYEEIAREIEAIARQMDGFVEFKTFTAQNGERLSLVIFASSETHAAWRDHPEHRRAQHLGRSRFYRSYDILVCRLLKRRRFEAHSAEESNSDA